MGKKGKQFISVLMILALLLGIFPTNVVWAAEQSDDVEKVLENPKVKTNSKMESGREVTWDCVWFGSYPQREVIPESLEGLYVLKNMWYEKDVSAIIDDIRNCKMLTTGMQIMKLFWIGKNIAESARTMQSRLRITKPHGIVGIHGSVRKQRIAGIILNMIQLNGECLTQMTSIVRRFYLRM